MSDTYADIVLTGNAIFTGVKDHPIKGSIAIKNNRILEVGTHEEIQPFVNESTRVLNYDEQLIMPGFNDFHVHLMLGSLSENSISLTDAKSEEEAAKMVKEFADTRPNDDWVFGFGWYHTYWDKKILPTKFSLDQLLPSRPVFLLNAEGHGAWVNSKALEIMGLNKGTPDPPFGHIVRYKNGEATGFLYETAMQYANIAFNSISKKRQIELLEGFQKYTAKFGITSISDMLIMPGFDLDYLELYKEFDELNKLTTRIHFLTALDGDLQRPKYLRKTYTSPKLRFSGLKQFLDGVPTTYTAYLVDPYTDMPETKGNTLVSTKLVKKWVREADREGFRIRLHACGDGAVKLGLDCFEAAQRENGIRDSRHTIEHIEVIHQNDIERFSELDVIASMQPEHMAAAETYENNVYPIRFGKARDHLTFPIKSLKDHNATVAFGSDFPVVEINPMLEIYRAVSRVHNDGEPVGGWNPKEKITIAEALRFYTLNSAYGIFRERELGTLEKGKLADITVLNQNLFTVPTEMIKKTEVILTIMDGKIVYKDEGAI